MRSSTSTCILALIASLLLSLVSAVAVDAQHKLNTVEESLQEPKVKAPEGDGPQAGATNSEAISSTNSKFNGMEVPPMKELTGEGLQTEIKNGYWFIKHYSPYCGHCKDIAPTWQTLYEFYYTMKPVPGKKGATDKDSMNSFTRYYDFHFASLDCVAYGDACKTHDVNAYPTFSVYKDGLFVNIFTEAKNVINLSKFVEDILESIRPGSRPTNLKLPEPGASSVETIETELPARVKDAAAAATSDVAETDSAKPPSKVKGKPKVKKPTGPANPVGTSIDLDAEAFQKLVTNTQDSWFVKFYAPWCHHCQALAPSWLQMAKELQGKLNIGEVNCDANPRLCKDVRVKAYPTIHFFRGGERVEYDGLRGLGDLVSYAKKALDVGSGVQQVDKASFEKMEETEEVIFIYFYDHATTSEDFEALERLTLSLIGHAKLVKTNDPAMSDRFKISTWPRLLVSRDGHSTLYEALAPKDMRDYRQVLTWMQRVWLPIVPELTASNSRDIMRGKYVVLGILSRDRADEFLLDKREIKNAALDWMEKQTQKFELERQELRDAKQLRLEEAEDRNDERAKRAAKSIHIDIRQEDTKQVGFAWVDGVFWERWIRTTYGINVKEGERVIINDEDVSRPLGLSLFIHSGAKCGQTEPKILGYHHIRCIHHPVPHLHPRNNSKGDRQSAQDIVQVHNRGVAEDVLCLHGGTDKSSLLECHHASCRGNWELVVRQRKTERDCGQAERDQSQWRRVPGAR